MKIESESKKGFGISVIAFPITFMVGFADSGKPFTNFKEPNNPVNNHEYEYLGFPFVFF